MKIAIRLVFCLLTLAASAATSHAQQPAASLATPTSVMGIDWPSPDGKFVFRTIDEHRIDLIDKSSQKTLLQIGSEDSVSWHALWAADSSRFALMKRFAHPIQGVDVYGRTGDTFRQLALPDLPNADIPERMKHGGKYPHVASMNWQEAREWRKDGSLLATVETMIDGAGRSITATRTVMLSFDAAGKGRIAKSTIAYKSEKD